MTKEEAMQGALTCEIAAMLAENQESVLSGRSPPHAARKFRALGKAYGESDQKEKEKDGCLASIGKLTISFPIGLAHAFVSGWVLAKLWSWFILPLWHDAPILTAWRAIGLLFVVRFFTSTSSELSKKKLAEMAPWGIQVARGLVWLVFFNGFALLAGYLWHLGIGP